MRTQKNLLSTILLGTLMMFSVACETKKATFSLLAEEDFYKQTTDYVPRKIDILWVVDNSGSMRTSQENLTSNFLSFINRMESLNYDYHIGVIGTDAWRSAFNASTTYSNLKDGAGSTHSGVFILDKDTPDVVNTFVINATLGTSGTGDERAFHSIKTALQDPDNAGFRREDAFLAVIILSDEDDFSHDGSNYINNDYNYAGLHTVASYSDFLTTYTNTTATAKNFSVSAITILDQGCADSLNTDGWVRYIGQRYISLVDSTGGVKGSLCSNFGDTLSVISDSIIEYSSVFPLSRKPIEASITVTVDGVTIPNDTENGWSYRAADNAVLFHGTAIPAAGAKILIDFDPAGVKI